MRSGGIFTARTFTYPSQSEQDTAALAGELARLLGPGSVVALDGDLGAGKTTFSQSVAKGLGVAEIVNSPTFTIIKEYEGTSLPFYHMDVYRLNQVAAAELGLDEYFYGDGVSVIEWASLIEELLPPGRLSIYIEYDGVHKRTFRITPMGKPYEDWCDALKESGLIHEQ